MSAVYTAINEQTINPGESAIFTLTEVPCNRGFVRHRDGTGTFLLSGAVPYISRRRRCCCQQEIQNAAYTVNFGANIAVATGGTVGAIDVALVLDGATLPSSVMEVTPAAVEEYFAVEKSTAVEVWRGCCETLAVRNVSDQPILMKNAVITFDRPDLVMSR
jgi:hypothetical protein